MAEGGAARGASGSGPPLRVLLWGGGGRMGQRVQACALDLPDMEIVAAPGRGDAPPDDDTWDLLLDFSLPHGTEAALELALGEAKPMVCGVTGHGPEQLRRLQDAAARIPLLLDANFSPGVALLRVLARQAARALPQAQAALRDVHHAGKLDAVSGTAKSLLAELPPPLAARTRVESVRQGDAVGEHRLELRLPQEVLRLEHVALDRDLFARGALRAALWLRGVGQPGLYSTADTLEAQERAAP